MSLTAALIQAAIDIKRGQGNNTKSPISRPHRTPTPPVSQNGSIQQAYTLFCSNEQVFFEVMLIFGSILGISGIPIKWPL